MKLNYTDEATFITEICDFTEEHYTLAEQLHKQYESERLSECTPLMVRKDKQSLVFTINLGDRINNRVAYERGDHIYKVVIEKVKQI